MTERYQWGRMHVIGQLVYGIEDIQTFSKRIQVVVQIECKIKITSSMLPFQFHLTTCESR